MGCMVTVGPTDTVVMRRRDTPLHGIDIDMAHISDLVPTLAVVATQATTPTRITGVGFIREKESDRLGDLAAELTKLGADITVDPDGLTIAPTDLLHGARLDTHHDHRLAMSFGLLGLVVDGIEIVDPDVVSKSWPELLGCARRDSGETGMTATRNATVAAFDVDGTVTDRDCVVPFMRLVTGARRVVPRLAARPDRLRSGRRQA